MTERKEEPQKVELPRWWQILQLFALQLFAGSFLVYVLLMIDGVQKAIIKGYGASIYAVILATFLIIGAVSGFLGGTKAVQFAIQTLRNYKSGKDE